jgi:hypothetical protein
VILQHLLELRLQVVPEEEHEGVHLQPGPAPVFGRESKKGQVGDPDLPGSANDPPNRLRPLAMPFHPVQGPFFRPTPVSVHDDGQMVRELFFDETMHFKRFKRSWEENRFPNKHQIPSTKYQISSNGQNPKLPQSAMFRSLKFGV